MRFAVSQASSVMKTCLLSGDGFSLQGYQGAFRHECSVSSIVKPQSPRGASPSGGACSQSAAFESLSCQVRECWCSISDCSQPVAGNTKTEKTQWCARVWATVVFVFILSGSCFVCAFVLSTFFAYVWCCVVGSWWPLTEAPGACKRSACHPAGFPVI